MCTSRIFLLKFAACLLLFAAVAGPAKALSQADVVYPSDAGVLNVKTMFGAKGDGNTDDTPAIAAAIAAANGAQQTVYFPAGTYLVTSTINSLTANGTWHARLTLQGQNAATTTIRLIDNAPAFQDPSSPQPVIRTGSGSAWDSTGSGYNGFRNYLFNLTVSTGKGNPGAVGVDFLGNNICGMGNVTIRTEDALKRGVAGLSLKRPYVGPCLFQNVRIDGFDYGVTAGQTEYSMTFQRLTLTGQNVAGVMNAGNVLSISQIASDESVPVIVNQSQYGLVTLIDSVLTGDTGAGDAIQNSGGLFLRHIIVSGYGDTVASTVGQPIYGSIVEYSSGGVSTLFGGRTRSLGLNIQESPDYDLNDPTGWANPVAFGADPQGRTDSLPGIQAAIDSGAPIVYLPIGAYKISGTIHLRGNVRKVVGLGSVIFPSGPTFAYGRPQTPVLEIDDTGNDLVVDGVQFGYPWLTYTPASWLLDNSSKAVVLRHVDLEGIAGGIYQSGIAAPGPLFLEDVASMHKLPTAQWVFGNGQSIWARQFDPEGWFNPIIDTGANLWIMGLKTEGVSTAITALPYTSVELLGGLLYPDAVTSPLSPAFSVASANFSATYAVSAYSSPNDYGVQISETNGLGGMQLGATQVPARGYGSIMTLFSDAPVPALMAAARAAIRALPR